MISGRAILVTGGCGFIGSHLVHNLIARGASRVVVIDSMRCGDPANLKDVSDAVQVVPFALGTDPTERLADALDNIDYVFHLAADKHQASVHRPRELLRSNVDGTYQLLEAAVSRGVKKVVYSSSLYAYGRLRGGPMQEDELPHPDTVYGISKLAGEHLLAHFATYHGLAYNVLRYFFVYGPKQFAGQGYKSVIVKSSELLLAGKQPVIFGDGEQVLDYIYVDDVIDATIRALAPEVNGEIFNIGSGVGTSVNRLVDVLTTESGRKTSKAYEPADWTAGTSRVGDVNKARERLGFVAKTSLEQGLSLTYRWIAAESRTQSA